MSLHLLQAPARIVIVAGVVLVTAFACDDPRAQTATVVEPATDNANGPPAARQFSAWLKAFNRADRAAIVAYHQQHFPYEVASGDLADVDRELRLSQRTGGFELKKPEQPSPTRIIATLKERNSEQFARAVMDVEASAPYQVVSFEIHPTPTPEDLIPADERQAHKLDDARRRKLSEGIASTLEAHYVYKDQAKRMAEQLRKQVERGDYAKIDRAEVFAERVTQDLRELSRDLHLAVVFGRAPKDAGPAHAADLGLGAIERMPGNIAHLVIHGFPPIESEEERAGLAKRMSQVADADALILDLRQNGGGVPETVALVASYLFDEKPVHLNDMFRRDTNSTTEFWTVRDLPGTRFGSKKPLYVLTSKATSSGGEELAYDVQALKRAKVVGETTAGAAHPVEPYDLDGWFRVLVPWGRPINPITKTDWEGAGVVPNVKVPAERALDEAHSRALAEVKALRKDQ